MSQSRLVSFLFSNLRVFLDSKVVETGTPVDEMHSVFLDRNVFQSDVFGRGKSGQSFGVSEKFFTLNVGIVKRNEFGNVH